MHVNNNIVVIESSVPLSTKRTRKYPFHEMKPGDFFKVKAINGLCPVKMQTNISSGKYAHFPKTFSTIREGRKGHKTNIVIVTRLK